MGLSRSMVKNQEAKLVVLMTVLLQENSCNALWESFCLAYVKVCAPNEPELKTGIWIHILAYQNKKTLMPMIYKKLNEIQALASQ